jgi:nucleoside-diphosphate-sugar epimerase
MGFESRQQCFLVTGALGCLGAWTVARLAREGVRVVAFDASDDPRRLRLLLGDELPACVTLVRGDVADAAQVEAAIEGHGVTHIVHLAALIHPQFRADPRRGARVNVLGGVNLFEAAAARPAQVQGLVYASSIAALTADTLYGVFKQAEEAMARVYFRDRGLASIGIRPAAVFGAGRDQGLSAGPTLALQAAVEGRAFHIGYGGRTHYHYADDLARIFIACARSGLRGAEVYDVCGTAATMEEVIDAIENVVPAARGSITFGGAGLGLPEDYDDSALRSLIGPVPRTPLLDALRQTRAIFQGGRIAAEPARG